MAGAEWIAGGAALLAAAGGVLRDWSGRRGLRAQVTANLELWDRLPEGQVRAELMGHIEASVRELIASDKTKRRNWGSVSIGVLFGLAASLTLPSAISGEDGVLVSVMWWLAFFTLSLFAMAGFATGVPKVRRDERGREIKTAPSDPD